MRVGWRWRACVQSQYVFIHDVVKHRLMSLGYGVTSPYDDDSPVTDDDEDLYQSQYCIYILPACRLSVCHKSAFVEVSLNVGT